VPRAIDDGAGTKLSSRVFSAFGPALSTTLRNSAMASDFHRSARRMWANPIASAGTIASSSAGAPSGCTVSGAGVGDASTPGWFLRTNPPTRPATRRRRRPDQ